MKKLFSHNILAWFSKSARTLPWRNTGDPYKTWVSEIIMQQTRVEQGTPYYIRFVEKFPDIFSLSQADENELLALWQGLGYYSRVLNLKKSAKTIIDKHGGIFPNTYENILKLNGVGPYTAGAISSICFNLPQPAIDGNVKRVIARYLGIKNNVDKPEGLKIIEKFLKSEISLNDPGSFNQALMEIGSLICKPKTFSCETCPLEESCVANVNESQHLIPVRSIKKKPKVIYLNYLVINNDKGLLCYKRDNSSIWKGLYEFPNIESTKALIHPPDWFTKIDIDNKETLIFDENVSFKHLLSHRTIFAKFWVYQSPETIIVNTKNLEWIKASELTKMGIPQLIQKFIKTKNL